MPNQVASSVAAGSFKAVLARYSLIYQKNNKTGNFYKRTYSFYIFKPFLSVFSLASTEFGMTQEKLDDPLEADGLQPYTGNLEDDIEGQDDTIIAHRLWGSCRTTTLCLSCLIESGFVYPYLQGRETEH